LDTALELIQTDHRIRAKKGVQKLSDPVWLSRIISASANANNNHGVVYGRWDGNYTGEKAPLTWNGSVKILQEYAKTKQPVKYGQCWVFSGVTTTLLRAIGIPCRPVSNFASAHDTD